MTTESLIALGAAISIFAASPGPAIFAIVARTLASGFWPGASFLLGCITGDIIYLLLAIFGLTYAANALGEIFIVIKFAGAAYLIWLGIRLWRSNPVMESTKASQRIAPLRGWSEGLLVTLASPKAILFFGAVLPTFLDIRLLSRADIVVVAVVVAVGIASVNMIYIVAATRARSLFRSRRAVRWLNRGTGSVMIGTGVALANR